MFSFNYFASTSVVDLFYLFFFNVILLRMLMLSVIPAAVHIQGKKQSLFSRPSRAESRALLW